MSTARPSGGRRLVVWLSAAVVALVLVTVAAVNRPESGSASAHETARSTPPTRATTTSSGAVPDAAALTDMLRKMSYAVVKHDGASFVEAAGSTPWGRRKRRNLEALGVEQVDLRYVARRSRTADVTVAVAWTPGARSVYDGTTTMARRVRFSLGVSAAGKPAVLGTGRTGRSPLPVWLMGRLEVISLSRGAALVRLAPDPGQALRVQALVRRATRTAHTVLDESASGSRRHVVVITPGTSTQAAKLVSAEEDLDGVAAITATADGSRSRQAPVHVVLNPAEFERLRPRGAQVVVTHEVTHALTGAAAAEMPLWVAEGFADWVGVRAVRLPVDVAAGRLLASVRRSGPPARLPTQADFARQDQTAIAYEAASTAVRSLARRVGEKAVVGFHADVVAGRPTESALRTNTGLGVAELTRLWRMDLRRLARG